MTNQDQQEQQAETWRKGEARFPTADGDYVYLEVPLPHRHWEGMSGGKQSVQMPEWLADAIIANHQAQQRLQDLEAETQVQLIEAEQRIVQAQEELAALRVEARFQLERASELDASLAATIAARDEVIKVYRDRAEAAEAERDELREKLKRNWSEVIKNVQAETDARGIVQGSVLAAFVRDLEGRAETAEAQLATAVAAIDGLFTTHGLGVDGDGTLFVHDEQALLDQLVVVVEARTAFTVLKQQGEDAEA